MAKFAEVFGDDHTAAARQLVELLPSMKSEFPDLTPHLVAAVLELQPDANTPLLLEFERTLDDCLEHPERVLAVRYYWQENAYEVYDWCVEKTNWDLAVKIMEGERRAGAEGHADFNDWEKIKLAYAYLGTKQWKEALDVFEAFGGKPLPAQCGGPWGEAFCPILTD
jgi:hypothetical protein